MNHKRSDSVVTFVLPHPHPVVRTVRCDLSVSRYHFARNCTARCKSIKFRSKLLMWISSARPRLPRNTLAPELLLSARPSHDSSDSEHDNYDERPRGSEASQSKDNSTNQPTQPSSLSTSSIPIAIPIPSSPMELIQSWNIQRSQLFNHSRSSSNSHSKHPCTSILFLSWNCNRASYIEHYINILITNHPTYTLLSSTLFLSAGIFNPPGSEVSKDLLIQAMLRGVDYVEQKPCAKFEVVRDMETYDYVVCVSRSVREYVLGCVEKMWPGGMGGWDPVSVEMKVLCWSDIVRGGGRDGRLGMEAGNQSEEVELRNSDEESEFEPEFGSGSLPDFLSGSMSESSDSDSDELGYSKGVLQSMEKQAGIFLDFLLSQLSPSQ